MENLFAALAGIFIALGLIKFGNPVILGSDIHTPKALEELRYQSWPIDWAYLGFIPLVLVGLFLGKWKKETPKWALLLPLLWLAWQFVAATKTVDPHLTALTLKHFTACIACFYLGWFALAEVKNLSLLWAGIIIGFFWVIRVGFEQHFGGLEQSRRYFNLYILPNLKEPPLDLIKKMSTNRIFSTLFYPNTLAATILLFLPITCASLWNFTRKLTFSSRLLLISFFAGSALACLFWSGSKSGWLLMLLLFVLAFLHLKVPQTLKNTLVVAFLILGLSGFVLKYATFFQKGATSVVARTDYWKAAVDIFKEHPILGTGPGTFSFSYQKIKPPGAEMARLCHNDYLQQAADSGFPGFLTYFGFIFGILGWLYRNSFVKYELGLFSIWLGVMMISAQSFVEFNLYIPALAWPTFLFLGYLLGRNSKPV